MRSTVEIFGSPVIKAVCFCAGVWSTLKFGRESKLPLLGDERVHVGNFL